MLHMPTHIDVAIGDYGRSVDANHGAIVADDKYFARQDASIQYAAYRTPCQAAEKLEQVIDTNLLYVTIPPTADFVESFLGSKAHVLVRIGRWEEILRLQLPTNCSIYCVTTASILYARGLALSALGQIPEAEAVQKVFEAARAAVPTSLLNSIPCKEVDVLGVALAMLAGQLEYRKGNYDTAFSTLRRAIEPEDALPYSDPPPWMQPVRHALGGLLLEQNRVGEAEAVFREDLGMARDFPRRRAKLNNVWGLRGLYECFTRSGKVDEALFIQSSRDAALASVDVVLLPQICSGTDLTFCAGTYASITRAERLLRLGARRLALRVTPGKNAVMADFHAAHVRNGALPVLLGKESLKKNTFYFDNFHPKWPFLHRGTFDVTKEPCVLIQSVIMMGLWIEGSKKSRDAATDLHRSLSTAIRTQMDRWRVSNRNQSTSWPMATYQSVLLQCIFALFLAGERAAIDLNLRYRIHADEYDLLVTLVESCRLGGIFSYPNMLAQHSSAVPLTPVWLSIEEIKRFGLALYKVCRMSTRLESTGADAGGAGSELLTLADLSFSMPDSDETWNSSSGIGSEARQEVAVQTEPRDSRDPTGWISHSSNVLYDARVGFDWI
ncbi:hypothetical protein CNMCM5623_001805 [Aspergillus felis]|uniref:Xylanolytic transcriptional activator regulatory domain-containing protein n=1 Tax=Aspergillus felis TaxID=1287682 RepID=A0A8H6UYI0_9EURO|nr:hypothetical protein CNMCM5623_001805 [Aspergillus felis]